MTQDHAPSPFHPGELDAQQRFSRRGDAARLAHMLRPALSESQQRFIAAIPFFFIATADADGACDCSFRGRERASEPAILVRDPQTLVFPDFAGNNLFLSLGNLLVNPQIGLLFVDFDGQTRLRVNGRTTLLEDPTPWRAVWPTAQRCIQVTITQAFPNCRKRIPRLIPSPHTRSVR